MLEPTYCIQTLFEQLGLPSDEDSIENFIGTNRIPDGVRLYEAEFWNPSQAKFLYEGLAQNADWAIVIDELNTRLRDTPA